eukprot:m.106915 g.106915  ORF g.106915 m.106915 type:complete len:135 (-) comp27758_c0_seq1:131-535(-)
MNLTAVLFFLLTTSTLSTSFSQENPSEMADARPDARAPAWTRGEIEPPAGEKTEGGAVLGVYTEEQQARLGVNEWGEKVQVRQVVGGKDLRPTWLKNGLEKPQGEKNMGTWQAAVFTAEQMARLKVTENGDPAP